MTFPYDAAYAGKVGVVKLVDAIAPNWRKKADGVPDLDTHKLFETLKRVVEEWKELGKFSVLDKDLQTLLCLASATDWFSKAQLAELDAWAGEVAECGEAEWMKHFPESELRTAVNVNLKGAQVTEVKIDKDQSCISVEYTGGNFGDGPHDGCVYLDDAGVKIYDHREKGKTLTWTGDIPDDITGLGKCLSGKKWKITWEYDGDEEEEGGGGKGESWSAEGWDAGGWSAEGWSAEGGGYAK
eukprot:TRINITY_DN27053_c0_g2_i1.p1 TRINITY_DN27053_c0_g2~~TRINITY_DN27053_c0_g2_i1.p1  ORF type:complete len:241 (-),score=66.07 TRINITY_DN27053_c0_g2_i1:277-999(-)